MGSQIATLFQTVMDWPVEVTMPDGTLKAPNVFGFASMPNSLSAHQLPARIVTIFGDGMDGTDVTFFAMDGSKSIEMFIDDTIFIAATGHGRGVGDVERALMETFQNYADLMAARLKAAANATLVRVRPAFGQFPFPLSAQSATFFYGLSIRLTITELS